MAIRKGAARGTGRGYKNLRGFPKDPRVHSDSGKGRKQPQRLNIQKINFRSKKLSPYDYQDKNQEMIIHSGWIKGNSYRFVLEGTGDIFRELANETPHSVYIEEKKRRIRNLFGDMEQGRKYFPKTGVHPEDSIEYSYKHNKDKFQKMIELWEKQPTETKKQEIARDLNIAMLKGNFEQAKKLLKQIR